MQRIHQLILTSVICLILSVGLSATVSAQDSLATSYSASIDTVLTQNDMANDSLLHVNLKSIDIIPPFKFKNHHQEKKYDELVEDVKKTYPLAMIVSKELNRVKKEMDKVYTSPGRRKKYLKWYQHYIKETYMDTLKTLNIRQGRLLLKLIDRETGETAYDLLKEYRGGGQAFLWNSLAFLTGSSLKSEFDPEEDAMLDHIIRRYEAGEFH
ncbi:hypothetical protein PbJCM13498_20560 [Prolixibacter bellariivorans]|uniref:DUF4294 domain-containing protein n=1 Tax=Prolixibacter bellariivorans TaxID=314319 RepID=A0A5M4B014_9BACT|nr:DUF4294 domain-containing protein [Prolixibacter bellariivorans]GET33193.1 hypothetical protein PbJCM13498_20560 [Prolixibacter bellariivorans]